MNIKKVMEQVYIFTDIGGCCANLVLGGERALLFDTGCGVEDMKKAVRSITNLPLLVINSHGHFDHIGGNPQFDETYLAKEDFAIIECYETAQLNGWLADMAKGTKINDFREPPREWHCMRVLDFDTFDLGDMPCRIIPMPGHSAGSVGVWIEKLDLLLSGDAMTPVMCMNFRSHLPLAVQLDTLRRMEKLPFAHYLTSHHDCLFEKEMVNRLIACIERSADGRFHRYQYPYPPYAKGGLYVDSLEGEAVGLILAEEDCPPDAFRRRRKKTNTDLMTMTENAPISEQTVDLHMHSTASDGQYTPEELVQKVKEAGIGVMALTDHDTVTGVPGARETARRLGILCIPGIELSIRHEEELHMLGYGIDIENARLQEFCEQLVRGRDTRADRIIEYLADYGLAVSRAEVEEKAGANVIGRGHFARVLVEKGYVGSMQEAFDRYLATPEFAKIERPKPSAKEGISMIHDAGGIAVLAHPVSLKKEGEALEREVRKLVELGLDGIETYYSTHSGAQVEEYHRLAEKYDLLETTGSDFHGEKIKPDIFLGKKTGGQEPLTDWKKLDLARIKAAVCG